MTRDNRPAAAAAYSVSFTAAAGDFNIKPAQRIDRHPIALVDQYSCSFSLDDRDPFEALARCKGFQCIEWNFTPFAEERLPRARDGWRSRSRPDILPVGRDLADRRNACVDKHDFLTG